jgi:hypothetical protein
MNIDQHPFPTNTIEVPSKDTPRVKLLTSDLAQNKGAVNPKVQATTADVKGKGFLLEERDLTPHRPVTSQMLINKFQRRQDKAKGGEEWAQRSEGYWRSPFFKYCWEKGIKLPTTRNVQNAMGLTTTTHLREFSSMTEELQLEITVNSAINVSQSMTGWGARIASMIGWGARITFIISWEAESMRSQTIDWKRWPIL